MPTDPSRTAHLLALMKKGDDAFNVRDFAAVDEVHHPGHGRLHRRQRRAPTYGREAHSGAMAGLLGAFPDMHVYSNPYDVQFGDGDWITVVTRVTGTFTGPMNLSDGTVVRPTGKSFDIPDFGQTTKWIGDQLIVISAFWDTALQARQLGLA